MNWISIWQVVIWREIFDTGNAIEVAKDVRNLGKNLVLFYKREEG